MDITTIALAVDSSQVNSASAALDRFAQSGDRAETASERMQEAWRQAGAAAQAGAQGVQAATRTLGAAGAAAEKGARGIERALDGVEGTREIDVDVAGVSAAAAELDRFAKASARADAAGGKVAATLRDIGQAAAAAAQGVGSAGSALQGINAAPHASAQAAAGNGATAASSATPALSQAGAALTAAAAALRQSATQLTAAAQKRPAHAPGTQTPAAGTQRAPSSGAGSQGRPAAPFGPSARMQLFQQQQIGFQLHDFFVQVTSGTSPLTALIQQGSQLSGAFGSVGGAVKAVTSLLTPMRVAAGGAAGVLGLLATAALQGASESRALADELLLSGNAAGQTEGRFNDLARSISASTTATIAEVREFAQALIATGEVGPQVFKEAAKAATLLGAATGATAEDVARDFASMGRDAAKWAADHNRSLNFITAAQYQQIKALQDAGREVEAQRIVYQALNQRLDGLRDNLGYIDRALNAASKGWSSFWDAAKGFGRAETVEQQLAAIERRLRAVQSAANGPGGETQRQLEQQGRGPQARLQAEQSDARRRQFRQSENADAEALRAEANKAGIEAQRFGSEVLRRANPAATLKKALEEARRQIQAARAAGTPFKPDEERAILEQVRKDNTPAGGGGRGRIDHEPEQLRRAQLQARLQGFRDELQAERDALQFHQQHLQGQYEAGEVSLAEFYARRNERIEQSVQVELRTLAKERDTLEAFARGTSDPSERQAVQARINEVVAESTRVQQRASNEAVLAVQDEARARRQLTESVREFQAQLLEGEGKGAEAAAIRAETAIARAQELSRQSGGAIDERQIARMREQIATAAQVEQHQRDIARVSEEAAIAEQLYALRARQAGQSIVETERGIFEIRAAALDQLGQLRDQVQALADANRDNPALQTLAKRLQLEYEALADAVDPTVERIKDANAAIADSIAETIGRSIAEFGSLRDALLSIQRDIVAITTRALVTEPLKAQLDGLLRGLTTGDGALAGIALKVFGRRDAPAPTGPQVDAENKRVRAVFEAGGAAATSDAAAALSTLRSISTDAAATLTALRSSVSEANAPLLALAQAANAAAQAMQAAAGGAGVAPPGVAPTPAPSASAPTQTTGDFARADRAAFAAQSGDGTAAAATENAKAQSAAAGAAATFSGYANAAASAVTQLAQGSNLATAAMSLLPAVIATIQASATASAASSSGGAGWFGKLVGFFAGGASGAGGSGGSASVNHSGGVIGEPGTVRSNKGRLAPDERRAILQVGEEVLTRDDPRHRDNLGAAFVRSLSSTAISSSKVVNAIRRESRAASALGREAGAGALPLTEAGKAIRKGANGERTSDNAGAHATMALLLRRIGVDGAAIAPARKLREAANDERLAMGRQHLAGRREIGGPVSAGRMYQVNERGPEVLTMDGRTYLMTGKGSGEVRPVKSGAAERAISNTNNFYLSGPVDRRTQEQVAAHAMRGVMRATARGTA